MLALRLHHKMGMLLMSVLAPRRLTQILLRPYPQTMRGELACSGEVEPVAFPTAGGLLCRGWWVRRPENPSNRCAILAHGWTSHALRMQELVEPLLGMGYQVLLYNARSHGNSDPYPVCSLVQFTEDVMAAVNLARQHTETVVLVGHSLGAAASLVAAADGAPVSAVVALAPPAHPAEASMEILRAEGMPAERIMARIGGHIQETIGRTFEAIAPERRVRDVGCPVLLVHGTQDEVVPFTHFERICRCAAPNVKPVRVEGADHYAVRTAPETLTALLSFLSP